MKLTAIKKKEGFQGQRAVVIPKNVLNLKCDKNSIIGNLYITDIGYYPKAFHHYRQRNQGAEQHILIFCSDGQGVVNLQHSEHKMAPGDYVVIPAGMRHSYAADPGTPWTIYWLHFKGSQAQHIVSHMQSKAAPVGFIQNREKVIRLFDEIYESLSRGYGSEAIMHANMCLWHLLSAFMNNRELDPPGESSSRNAVNTAIDFLRANMNRVLTLQEIAAEANLSVSHFSSLFRKNTGFTPIEYFNHLRVQKACQYLLFTQMRIKEIALELGIEDAYYFSRVFTRVMGMSPNHYRERRAHS